MCNLHMDKLFINMYLPVDSDMLLCHKNGIRLECVSRCIYTCTVETRMTKIIKKNCIVLNEWPLIKIYVHVANFILTANYI